MPLDRRTFLAACSRAGIASPLLSGILYTPAAFARAYQQAAGFEQLHPKLD
jgi:hypothetical protein